MNRALRNRPYAALFFWAYFFYYSGYAVFSSYVVMYLTDKGLNASVCGIVASLMLLVNLCMEPVGGYMTDTWLSSRRLLVLCIAVLLALFFCAHLTSGLIPVLLVLIVLTAGIAYPFSQLMDAWVEISQESVPVLVYSRIRAGGSIGFAITSMIAGGIFSRFGFSVYFLLQAMLFAGMIPILLFLPDIPPSNTEANRYPETKKAEERISFLSAFRILIKKPAYVFWLTTCTLYWFTHRPVGSYLSLMVTARGGGPSTYGNVCGIGAAVEFLCLLFLGRRLAAMDRSEAASRLMRGAVLVNLLRPACLLLPGIWPLYLGQILQSVGFALYLSGSVECFRSVAEEKIRSFSISVGLAVSSVVGMTAANLLGGVLCDLYSVKALPLLSLTAGILNIFIFNWRRSRMISE